MQQFSELLTLDQLHRRAGGRRRHNADRKFRQASRRHLVCREWLRRADLAFGDDGATRAKLWGMATALAEHFGVSRATISRDLRAVGVWGRWPGMARRR